jgi:RNase P subunit RPR2
MTNMQELHAHVQHMWNAAWTIHPIAPHIARTYVEEMCRTVESFATKSDDVASAAACAGVLTLHMRQQFCSQCYTLLIPGMNSTTRVRASKLQRLKPWKSEMKTAFSVADLASMRTKQLSARAINKVVRTVQWILYDFCVICVLFCTYISR